MRKTETVELTVLCLIEDGNRILLQNRVKKDWQGYALPGGHVEPGESFVDAVIREMREETGLTVIEPRLAGVKQFPIENGRYVVLLFKATRWFGDLISSDEGQMEWIEYDNLTNITTVDDFDELIRVINTPGLTVIDPRLAGVKQFPIENGRYIVLLFKATRWSGDLISSDEGQMEWVEYDNLTNIKTVDDFDELIRVINSPELTEFQYLVSGDEWTVSIR